MNDKTSADPLFYHFRIKRAVLFVVPVLGLLGLAVVWKWRPDGASKTPEAGAARADDVDPRLAFPTPYQNVRPDVKYVGDRACADCHVEQSESYRQHPMGRALAPVAGATPIEQYEPAASNPFVASGLHYDVRRREGHVFHREWAVDSLGETSAEVQFAVGSGARARSYVVNHDGYLFQSPVTWYPQGKRWDLSPSYAIHNQHFGRPVAPGCLFCHCNYAEHVPDTVNRYRQPIFQGFAVGCERCHGPGELHVRRQSKGEAAAGPDDTIVNPARLEHSLREAVCRQCHLQGEERVVSRGRSDFDYRPGLPLHLFLLDFVDGRERGADFKFVSSVEQMAASRCYNASREPKKLGCVSCHDPHKQPAPEEKVAHYRKRCLQCHTEASCSLPSAARREKNKEDSCVACHMPRTGSEVSHAAMTDHRVPRRAAASTPPPAQRPTPGPADLVPFPRDFDGLPEQDLSRNRGLALMAMLNRGMPDAVARQFAGTALPLLEEATARDKHDAAALKAKGDALWNLGRREDALAAFENVLADRPEFEAALHSAGILCLEMNHTEAARSYLERAVSVNPWRRSYPHGLAVASFRRGEWGRAARECRQALRLEPTNAASRSLLVQCLLGAGTKQEALAEYETLRRMTPEGRQPDLRRWLDEQVRRLPP